MSAYEQTNPQSPTGVDPLRSTLADDPDMAELVQFFVEEMGERIETIRTAASDNDLGQLRVVAHQLKGSATGYGFEPISRQAAGLEKSIDSADPATDVDAIRAQVDELIDLCKRVSF